MSPLVNGQRTKYNIFYAAKIGNISKNIAFIIQQKIRPSFEGRIIYILLLFISLFLHNYDHNRNHNGGNHKIRTCAEDKYAEISEKLSDIVKTLGEFFTDLRAEA